MADEGFLQRWSRRKAAARTSPGEPEPGSDATPERAEPEAAAPPGPVGTTEARAAADPDAAVDLAALPEIDTLTYESDFTAFMRRGVPLELRNRALQRLWRSNPTLANLDGLLEYGEDYSKIGTTKQVVRTIYQVGRGMLARVEAQAAGEETASAAATAAAAERPPVMPDPAEPAAAPVADQRVAEGPDVAVAPATTREQAAPRPALGEERQDKRAGAAKKPRRLPKQRS